MNLTFYRANIKKEPKDAALMTVPGIEFQGSYFRPCVGLILWIRWGDFVIDIRPLRKYLELSNPIKRNGNSITILSFADNINEIINSVKGRNFMKVLFEASKIKMDDEDY